MDKTMVSVPFEEKLALEFEKENMNVTRMQTETGATIFTKELTVLGRSLIRLEFECDSLIPAIMTYRYKVNNRFTNEELTKDFYYQLNENNKDVAVFWFTIEGTDLVIQTTEFFEETKIFSAETFMINYHFMLDQFSKLGQQYLS
ncbi:hypothetical protein [Alkalibacterium sp. 20]|uniref:hypothetical protein n=1 Tax=Alkalibacterium sp. 20 TaxID=1798803 RepID=UPI0009004D2B|nr:hypothetical protein [Alkalibacterium sp. 20]OJF94704.1 hypothetical protein AX762_07445 [Alkalibacterium sp. 20]